MSAWKITLKDLKLLTRDRRALVVLVILPMAFISIFGMTTGRLLGWHAQNKKLQLALVSASPDETHNVSMRKYLGEESDGIEVTLFASLDVALKKLGSRENAAVIYIGPTFSENIDEMSARDFFEMGSDSSFDSLESLDVAIHTHGSAPSTDALVRYIVSFAVMRTAGKNVVTSDPLLLRLMSQAAPDESAPSEDEIAREQRIKSDTEGGPQLSFYQTLVPSFTVMFAFFLLNIMARSFIAEREIGTLRRLRLAPISPFSLLIGKTVPFLIISLVQCATLFICGRILFGLNWGSLPWLLIPVIFCTSLAATTLGLLISTVVRTDSQVSAYANLLVLTTAGISGCFLPRDWMPEIMQQVSLATPHAWSLMAFDELLVRKTPNVGNVMSYSMTLLGFAAAFFGCGWWRFQRMS